MDTQLIQPEEVSKENVIDTVRSLIIRVHTMTDRISTRHMEIMEHTSQRLENIEKKMDVHTQKFESLENKMDKQIEILQMIAHNTSRA